MAISTVPNTSYSTINTIVDNNKCCVIITGLEIVVRAIRINCRSANKLQSDKNPFEQNGFLISNRITQANIEYKFVF